MIPLIYFIQLLLQGDPSLPGKLRLQQYQVSMSGFYYRDFLSVRRVEIDGNNYYAASQAITSNMKPEQPDKVR